MKDTKVDYKDGKFIIVPPRWDFTVARGFPNRRWVARLGCWLAPAIRVNIEYIKANLGVLSLTDVAMAKVSSYERPAYAVEKFPLGYKFKVEPRVVQRAALDFLWGKSSAALFMDMRTGKTKTVVDWLSALHLYKGLGRALVICPLSVRGTWWSEFSANCPVGYSVHLLDTKKVMAYEKWLDSSDGFKVLVVGVESLAAGRAADLAASFVPQAVVVDESSKIKNHSARRTKQAIRLGSVASWRAILTGTPIANSIVDLFAQFEFLDTNIIGVGDFYSFRARYVVLGGFNNKQVVGYTNVQELMELVKPYTFQARKADVFGDLPPKTYIKRVVEMTKEQRRVYDSLKKGDGCLLQVRTVLEKMLRLQQVAGGFLSMETETGERVVSPIGSSNAKVDELLSVLSEVDGQVVIWAAFKAEIDLICSTLAKVYGSSSVVRVDGSVGELERRSAMDAFQSGRVRFYVGTVSTSGMGVSLSAADVEIYYSNTFSFIDREQSEERAFNAGKPLGTLIVDIVAAGSVDQYVLAALMEKKDVSEYVREHFVSIVKDV